MTLGARSRPTKRDSDRDQFLWFLWLVWAEWTKLRSVRAWLIALVGAAVAMAGTSLLSASGQHTSNCNGQAACRSVAVGPGGEPVADSYELVHRPLTGNGSITVEATSLTGILPPSGHSFGEPIPPAVPVSEGHPGTVGWAKAGLIITTSTHQGAPYAAVMVTAGHGVRFQYDYTHDLAGPAGKVTPSNPRWLRLARTGDTITASTSADGLHWARIGTARVPRLTGPVQAGMFVTSPQDSQLTDHPFVTSGTSGPSIATATFTGLAIKGARPAGRWVGQTIGGPAGAYPALNGSYERLGTRSYRISGSGDIAPAIAGPLGYGITTGQVLDGLFVALIVVIALGAVFASAEYRRALIRTTLTATPRRRRVLAAKAVVIGVATFVVTLPAAAVSVIVGDHILRADHNLLYPVSPLTELRLVVGVAGFLAVSAVIALALGFILRRSTGAIATVVAGIVLPLLLFAGLPTGGQNWLLRVSPDAALAVLQTLPVYHQVTNNYAPTAGYYPLSPAAGFAVLCAYAALSLTVATVLLRRRDA